MTEKIHHPPQSSKWQGASSSWPLPGTRAIGKAPFEAVVYDFMGPYEVERMCGGKRRYKVLVAVYFCFSSRYSIPLATPLQVEERQFSF